VVQRNAPIPFPGIGAFLFACAKTRFAPGGGRTGECVRFRTDGLNNSDALSSAPKEYWPRMTSRQFRAEHPGRKPNPAMERRFRNPAPAFNQSSGEHEHE